MRIAILGNLTERIPIDLALVITLTLACILFVLAPRLNETPVQVVLGLLLVLFLPGYSLIAALFPRRDDLDGIEQIALSFGLSIAIVPLIGLALNYTPYGSRLGACASRAVSVHDLVCRGCGCGCLRRSGLWLRDGGWGVVEMIVMAAVGLSGRFLS